MAARQVLILAISIVVLQSHFVLPSPTSSHQQVNDSFWA